MLFHLVVGAAAAVGFLLLLQHVQKSDLVVAWWGWLLTIAGILYGIFVLELIYGFAAEGMAQGVLVMGLITGIVAVIWGVLLARFVFAQKAV